MMQQTMQIRAHRGGLEESVATMKTIPATMEAVREHVAANWTDIRPWTQEELQSIQVDMYYEDAETRIEGWDGSTYIISFSAPEITKSANGRAFFGYCSKDPNNLPEEKVIGIETPILQPQTPEAAMDRAQDYVQKILRAFVRNNLGGNAAEIALQALLGHKSFKYWTEITQEQRKAGLSDEVLTDLDEVERRLADVRYVFEQIMPMVASAKSFESSFLRSMRSRHIEIYNEPRPNGNKYYIGIRGEWGWLHIYNGN